MQKSCPRSLICISYLYTTRATIAPNHDNQLITPSIRTNRYPTEKQKEAVGYIILKPSLARGFNEIELESAQKQQKKKVPNPPNANSYHTIVFHHILVVVIIMINSSNSNSIKLPVTHQYSGTDPASSNTTSNPLGSN